jgi:hypothetical protein
VQSDSAECKINEITGETVIYSFRELPTMALQMSLNFRKFWKYQMHIDAGEC